MIKGSASHDPPLTRAMNLTLAELRDRTHRYRNLVITCIMLVGVDFLLLVATGRWSVAWGILLLIPTVTGFVARDALCLERWRHSMVTLWREEPFDPPLLRRGMQEIRSVPVSTVGGMLDSLPADLSALSRATAVERTMLQICMATATRCHRPWMGAAWIGIGLCLPAAGLAIGTRNWWFLLGVAAIIPMILYAVHCALTSPATLKRELGTLSLPLHMTNSQCVALIDRLDWGLVPKWVRRRILHEVRMTGESERPE